MPVTARLIFARFDAKLDQRFAEFEVRMSQFEVRIRTLLHGLIRRAGCVACVNHRPLPGRCTSRKPQRASYAREHAQRGRDPLLARVRIHAIAKQAQPRERCRGNQPRERPPAPPDNDRGNEGNGGAESSQCLSDGRQFRRHAVGDGREHRARNYDGQQEDEPPYPRATRGCHEKQRRDCTGSRNRANRRRHRERRGDGGNSHG